MRHQDLIFNHIIESWTYPTAAARTGASGFITGDVGRIAYQQDTGQYWRLTTTAPGWQIIASPTYASLQTTPVAPTSTTSTTAVMMGLGASASPALITPTATGKIFMTIHGFMNNTVVNATTVAIIGYGLVGSGIPANGAPNVGTSIGSSAQYKASTVGVVPFSCSGLATGATVGVQYWIDLKVYTSTAGTASINGVSVAAVELP